MTNKTLIKQMVIEIKIIIDELTGFIVSDGNIPKVLVERMRSNLKNALTAYEAEKSLLAKTQSWHNHGSIAPSCVGCPTAEAVIESGKYTRVVTERLDVILNRDCPPHRKDIHETCTLGITCKKCREAYLTGRKPI